jgi:hypothetical protein
VVLASQKDLYGIDKFTYVPEENCYLCPEGKLLKSRSWTLASDSGGRISASDRYATYSNHSWVRK